MIIIGVTWPITMGGGGQNQPCVLGTKVPLSCSYKMEVFYFLLSLHHPNTCFENIPILLFTPLQLNSQKLFLGRKNIGGGH
jgi:hypothetical protein